MLMAQKYFPDNFPFYHPSIIQTLAEWEAVKEHYGEKMIHRVDYPLGRARRNAVVGTTGLACDVEYYLEQIHAQRANGALLIWQSRHAIVPRYQNLGGFNIAFSVSKEVIIELVGLGFDGSDLTSGRARHEFYRLPWAKTPTFYPGWSHLGKFSSQHFSIAHDPDGYATSRERRIAMLQASCRYNSHAMSSMVPLDYRAPVSAVMNELFAKIIGPIVTRTASLWHEGLTEFAVQGNIPYRHDGTGWTIEVWEMFCPERWGAR